MITVNVEALEKILGGHVPLVDDLDHMTARAITDGSGEKIAQEKFGNTRSWLRHAFNAGRAEGQKQANDAWISKIKKLFEI